MYELTVTSLFIVDILKCDIFFFFFLIIKCQEYNKNRQNVFSTTNYFAIIQRINVIFFLILKFENFAVLSKNIRYYFDNQRLSRACIVHLVIKKTNWSYVKTMSCSGSHLEITINIKNTKFVKGPSNE